MYFIFIIHSSAYAHKGCSQYLTDMSRAAVNMGEQVSLC